MEVDAELLARVLEAAGFERVDTRKGFIVMKHPLRPRYHLIRVEFQIAESVLQAHLENAGMSYHQFRDLLKRVREEP
jgi:hypothetical protein